MITKYIKIKVPPGPNCENEEMLCEGMKFMPETRKFCVPFGVYVDYPSAEAAHYQKCAACLAADTALLCEHHPDALFGVIGEWCAACERMVLEKLDRAD